MKPMRVPMFVAASLLFIGTAHAAGQPAKPKAADLLDGKWTMTVTAPPPHGDAAMGLELKQDAKKVTATFAPPHGAPIPLEGEFVNGTLSLAVPSKDGDPQLSMTAKLHDDGTLAGFMSSVRGDMTWTAVRQREKPTAAAKGRP